MAAMLLTLAAAPTPPASAVAPTIPAVAAPTAPASATAPLIEAGAVPVDPPQAGLPQVDLRLWNPGNIISDAVFFDARTMNAPQVQQFLNNQGAYCTSTVAGTCLKDYRQDTYSRPADQFCAAYQGAPGESAAEIIVKVAQACQINPQVLLTKLQVEQSLVSRKAPASAATYDKAMGYACPDTAACNPAYAGFYSQVYWAAHRFREYPTLSWVRHKPGTTVNVRYHPNPACGSSPVYIANQATANLYNYTPYQPNQALLDGRPDGCSAYGNLNFFRIFSDWFGSPASNPPIGRVEGLTTTPLDANTGRLTVSGWALDPDTTAPIAVHVYVDSTGYAVTANIPRADVEAVYNRGPLHGYTFSTNVSAGSHWVCVYAIDNSGGPNTVLTCQSVVVAGMQNQAPFGQLEGVSTSGGTITASGWAMDRDTTNPIAVHVYVGSVGTPVTANIPRADVGAYYGTTGNHGFTYTGSYPPGEYDVCAYAIDFPGGYNPSLGCRRVTVTGNNPIGQLQSVEAGNGQITVTGWAHDPDTTNPIYAQMYVDWRDNTVALANGATPGLTATVPTAGPAHAFSMSLPASPGIHTVCVYGINVGSGVSSQLGCSTVDVGNTDPIGNLEFLHVTPGKITAGGWAFDPDTTEPIIVQMYVDWRDNAMTWASIARADVEAVYPSAGANHGFYLDMAVAPGLHTICLYAINVGPGQSKQFVCGSVIVP
jgi:hypothetical protein